MAETDPTFDPAITDDVDGHRSRIADAEATEEDDVGGHMMSGEIAPDIYGDSRRTP